MARRNAHFRRRFNASGPLERVLILIVLAVAIGVTIGLLLPQVSSDAGQKSPVATLPPVQPPTL